jgi:hypothetical protein
VERDKDGVREEVKMVNYKHYVHVYLSVCLSVRLSVYRGKIERGER